jgi:hypothetical protein
VTNSAYEDYFVVERGWFWRYQLFLPRRVIQLRETKGITLTLSKEDLESERWKTPPLKHQSGEAGRPFFPPRPPAASRGAGDQGVVQAPGASPTQPEHLTLQASLEAVVGLGAGYLLTGAGDEWTAGELLHWLQRYHPQSLPLPVYLVPPEAMGEGALYEVGPQGDVLTRIPLYRIERRQPTVLPL